MGGSPSTEQRAEVAESPPAERRPAILAVDDEAVVLAAVARDLRRGFGERYRILRASSGAEALELLAQVRARGDQVALLLADQRMPVMAGTDFLVQARAIVPDAKRVLLTAYADTSAAIAAINEVAPRLLPAEAVGSARGAPLPGARGSADDLGGRRGARGRAACASSATASPRTRTTCVISWPATGFRRTGTTSSATPRRGSCSRSIAVDETRLPVAVLEDGTVLERPTVLELAERLGVTAQPTQSHYDLVIVGGGPAGLAAAVYGASEGLRTVLVERDAPGGQAGTSSRIENYLGFPAGLSGSDLARRATDQARRLGAELLTVQDAAGLRIEGAGRAVELTGGAELSANCVLIASGVAYRQLEAPGFADFTGAGIYYGAALSEARSCADQSVVIIGGANSAGQAAVHFSGFAAQVTMLVRGPSLERSMSRYLIEQIAALPNIVVRTGSSAVAAEGEGGRLRSLRIRDADGSESDLASDACFVFIGASPRTDWLEGVVARDERGFILAGPDAQAAGWPLKRDPLLLETTVPGVFVAGDVRARSFKRVASAVGEGSMAVSLMHQYLVDA